jgi:hypothetical protein
MNVTLGFCEVALVVSLFYFPQSYPIGVGLLSVALAGSFTKFLLAFAEKQEKKKEMNEASQALKKSLDILYGVKKTPPKEKPSPTLVFRRPEDDDDTFH